MSIQPFFHPNIPLMNTEKITIAQIVEALSKDIHQFENEADSLMCKLERLNTSTEDYMDANRELAIYCFATYYLRRIKSQAEYAESIKEVEMMLRFHAYYQHTKWMLNDDSDTSMCRTLVADTINKYIETFFSE